MRHILCAKPALQTLRSLFSFQSRTDSDRSFRPTLIQLGVELKPALSDLRVGHISWVRNVVLTTKYGDAEVAKVAEEQVVQKGKGLANSIVYPDRRFSRDV